MPCTVKLVSVHTLGRHMQTLTASKRRPLHGMGTPGAFAWVAVHQPMTGRLVREAVVVQQLASGVSVGYPLKNSYFRPRAVDMGVGDGCWPMRPPGAVITRTGMNTCGKQLLCRNCARLAPLLPPPRLPRRLQ